MLMNLREITKACTRIRVYSQRATRCALPEGGYHDGDSVRVLYNPISRAGKTVVLRRQRPVGRVTGPDASMTEGSETLRQDNRIASIREAVTDPSSMRSHYDSTGTSRGRASLESYVGTVSSTRFIG